jgi:threonine/homoserine/homoserine lactone efflux protein
VGEIAGIALLLFFGVRTLRDGLRTEEAGSADDEMADAEDAVKKVQALHVMQQLHVASFVTTARCSLSLMFSDCVKQHSCKTL